MKNILHKNQGKVKVWVVLLILVGLAGASAGSYFLYVYIKERQTVTPPPIPPLMDELTTVFNGLQSHTTKCTIYVRDKLSPTQTVVGGITVYIYAYGTTEAMISKGDATLLDTLTTDSNGKATSIRDFTSGTLLTAVVGNAGTTNKSELKDFVMQGQESTTLPPDINCGIFYYTKMAEESEVTISWTDNTGTALGSSWNYTADADKILDAKVKVLMANSGKAIRGMWDQYYKGLSIVMAVKITHYNSTASAAVDVLSTATYKGTPSNQLVFVFTIADIIYEVDSTGQVEGTNEAYRFYTIKLDFSGCSFVDSASTDTQFLLGGWLECEADDNLDQAVEAGLPSSASATWFQKAFPSLIITT